jgi:hypothetical protein
MILKSLLQKTVWQIPSGASLHSINAWEDNKGELATSNIVFWTYFSGAIRFLHRRGSNIHIE